MPHADTPSRHGLARAMALCGCLWAASIGAALAAPQAGTSIVARVTATYIGGGGYQVLETATSSPVTIVVDAVPALQLSPGRSVAAGAGSTLNLPHTITNTGNAPSTYSLALAGGAGGAFTLDALAVVLDLNANGVHDAADRVLPLGRPGALALAPGEVAHLLVVGRVPATATGGAGQVRLSVTIDGVAQAPTTADHQVAAAQGAALTVTHAAAEPGPLVPGARVAWTVLARNLGVADARGVPATSPAAQRVLIDGRPAPVLLLRAAVPAGTGYVAGSLTSPHVSAVRLFRLPGDAALSYRTGADDAAAVELAVALPPGLAPDAALALGYTVRLTGTPGAPVRSVASALFDDGAGVREQVSNDVVLPTLASRLGVALAAQQRLPVPGAPAPTDDTATWDLSLRLANLGARPLHDVALTSLLEGRDRLGSYTAAAVPGPGQYTVVAGSLAVAEASPGVQLQAHSGYQGSAAQPRLLAPGGVLPAGSTATVTLAVRLHAGGRVDTAALAATARAAYLAGAEPAVVDDSVDGDAVDPDGDGDPTDNASPTPLSLGLERLALQREASVPVPVAGQPDTFELELRYRVRNAGTVPLTFVRVAENLACSLGAADVASWQLAGPPAMRHGLLRSSGALFTGRVPCTAAHATALPGELALGLADGTRALLPGQQEEIVVPLRLVRRPGAVAPLELPGTAHAAAFDAPLVAGARLRAAASATSALTLAPPGGVVYRADTRAVVPGAVVSLRRLACDAGPAGPIGADQLVHGDLAGHFTFDADGSVSMTTGADGSWQFLLRAPPVASACDYRLAVQPPAGLAAPSAALPPQPGPAPGGAVQAQPGAPGADQPTPYHLLLRLGPGLPGVWHNHVPVDPVAAGALLLRKTGSKSTVEVADFLTYVLVAANRSSLPMSGLEITDTLPAGFALVPGSVRLVDAQGQARSLPDPSGGTGPRLRFDLAAETLPADAQLSLRYRVRVGVGAVQGDGVNRAVARSGPVVSNEAAHRVQVQAGVFGGEAVLFGKVFLDCNADGMPGPGEPGVPGVRLLLQNGTAVVTDVEGKWSLYGLKPTTHVLKVDPVTLPPQATLALVSPRQAGRPGTRFLDLKHGEMHRADVALVAPGPDGCAGATGVWADVQARRAALAARPDADGEAAVAARPLDLPSRAAASTDVRGLPAAGTVSTGSSPVSTSPTPIRPTAPPAQTAATVAPPSLEDLMPTLDATAGFIGLTDGQVMPRAQASLRVKGRRGSELRLSVNGEPVSDRRVGQKSELAARDLVAWEYIGVALQVGDNRVVLDEVDGFGVVRASVALTLVAPGPAAQLAIDAPPSAPAAVQSPLPVRLRVLDARGVPVAERTAVTLEASRGRWADADLDPQEPGLQRFVEGGSAVFMLVPPAEPGRATLRASLGTQVRDAVVDFLPELRPLVGAGLVDGVIDLRGRGRTTLQPARERDAFEAELKLWSHTTADGRVGVGARTAFYFKGAILGQYLLTTAYDSDKAARERLFRDIRPDEFYPVYGDSSVKSFDAQSTGRFYVRVDHGRSYLLYGDFNTAAPSDTRRLTQFSRSVTGLQHHYQGERLATTVFASRDSLRQQVEEFAANGTSGPFVLGRGGDFYAQSEKVELVVRDRHQAGTVLSVTPLARFVDYEIEPATGRLLFKGPVASVDENLNPRSVRVTYEVETGGPAFWLGGAEVQVKVADSLQVGALHARDEDPGKPSRLTGLTAQWRPGDKSVVNAELAQTHTVASGDGRAARVEARVEEGPLSLKAQASRTGASFDNPGAYAQKGRDEVAASVAYRLGERVSLTAEALGTRDLLGDRRSSGVLLGARATLAEGVELEAGLRAARSHAAAPVAGAGGTGDGGTGSAAAAAATLANPVSELHSLRARLTVQPRALPQAKGYVEAEQDVSQHERRLLAFGGSYQLGERTRLFGRYEAVSTLGNPLQLGSSEPNHVAALGLESTYLPGHSAFSEYRVRDTVSGRENLLATGLRSRWAVAPGFNLGLGFERTAAVGGTPGQRATALSTSADHASPGLRVDGRLELRRTDSSDSVLNTLGLAYKLDADWSLLARSAIEHTATRSADGADTLRLRQQLGLAWRPVDGGPWNALARYEHRQERRDGGPAAAATTDSAPGLSLTHIVSAHASYQARRDLLLSGRYAVRHHALDADGLRSATWAQLLSGRATWDLAPRWDAGLLALVHAGQGGVRQLGLGAEAGYRVADDLWLSVGFNAFDLRDDALAGDAGLQRGLYLRLRFKFDEGIFR